MGVIGPRQLRLPLAGCLLLAACGPPASDVAGPCARPAAIELPELELEAPDVSRHNLRSWVELLTSPRLRGRHAGEAGARDAAALVAAEMARIGLEPPPTGGAGAASPDAYCRAFPFLDAEDYNVVGHLAPDDRGPVVIVGAHYDGQGVHPAGMIYPGADDNASGIAGLLEVARLAALRPVTGIAWVFVAFGAEEGGRQGSRAFLSAPTVAARRVELAINLDMIGRPLPDGRGDAIGYLAAGDPAPSMLARLRAAAERSRLEILSLEALGERMPTISDAEVLAERWPTLLLSTALHEDHHQLTDTVEKVDFEQIERAVRLVLTMGSLGSEPSDRLPKPRTAAGGI